MHSCWVVWHAAASLAATQNSLQHSSMCAGPLPPDWGTQVFFVDGTVNSTQALEKL